MVESAPSSRDADPVGVDARGVLDQAATGFEVLLQGEYCLIDTLNRLGLLDDAVVPALLAAADQVGGAVNDFRRRVSAMPSGWWPGH